MIKRLMCATALLLALDGFQAMVYAVPITISDLNSTFSVEPQTQAGAFSWQVDGTSHLFQQWFWYRVGGTGAEASIDTLPFQFAFASNADADPGLERLQIRYQNSLFRLDIQYDLVGSTSGSQVSKVNEQITIRNLQPNTGGPSTLNFHLFEYDDFDLSGTAGDDTAQALTTSSINQTDATAQATVNVTQNAPTHYEIDAIDTVNDIKDRLNDGSTTTLSDTPGLLVPVGPDNVAFAFQWDPVIVGMNSTFVIRKEKLLGPATPGVIPEPGTLLLLGSALAGLESRRRRRARSTC